MVWLKPVVDKERLTVYKCKNLPLMHDHYEVQAGRGPGPGKCGRRATWPSIRAAPASVVDQAPRVRRADLPVRRGGNLRGRGRWRWGSYLGFELRGGGRCPARYLRFILKSWEPASDYHCTASGLPRSSPLGRLAEGLPESRCWPGVRASEPGGAGAVRTPAWAVAAAETAGTLAPAGRWWRTTAGNGLGLAMVCAVRGY